jgi:epoxyqueuosine reductase
MTPADFSMAFKNSPMKRAKLGGLQRNAAVVLENVAASGGMPRRDCVR